MKRRLLVSIIAFGLSGLSLGQNGQDQNDQDQNDQDQNDQGQNGQGQDGTHAPEIDPSQAVTAFALVSGSILVIRGRRTK